MKTVGFWIAVAIVFVFVALLASCATDATKPEVVTRVEQLPPIKVPVLIKCIDASQVPDIPATSFTPDQALWTKAQKEAELGLLDTLLAYANSLQKQAMADIDAFKIYALKADPLLKGCATDSQPTTEVKK